MPVLFAMSFCHLLNDMMQSLLPAIYPDFKAQFHLNFAQIGLVTLAFQCTASLLQPVVGYLADNRPMPYSLPVGMVFTLAGLLILSLAGSYPVLLMAAVLIGVGLVGVSSGIRPRGAHGLGRPARPGAIDVPGRRQYRLGARPADRRLAWWRPMASAASPGMRRWRCSPSSSCSMSASGTSITACARIRGAPGGDASGLPQNKVAISSRSCWLLIFSKYLLSDQHQQLLHLLSDPHLPRFGADGAVASVRLPGRRGGRHAWWAARSATSFGRKYVIWFSILGMLPFTLMLPYANLFWTGILSVVMDALFRLLPYPFGILSPSHFDPAQPCPCFFPL